MPSTRRATTSSSSAGCWTSRPRRTRTRCCSSRAVPHHRRLSPCSLGHPCPLARVSGWPISTRARARLLKGAQEPVVVVNPRTWPRLGSRTWPHASAPVWAPGRGGMEQVGSTSVPDLEGEAVDRRGPSRGRPQEDAYVRGPGRGGLRAAGARAVVAGARGVPRQGPVATDSSLVDGQAGAGPARRGDRRDWPRSLEGAPGRRRPRRAVPGRAGQRAASPTRWTARTATSPATSWSKTSTSESLRRPDHAPSTCPGRGPPDARPQRCGGGARSTLTVGIPPPTRAMTAIDGSSEGLFTR